MDILFPVVESEVLTEGIPDASLSIIDSLYGHDGFLIETEQLKIEFEKFYKKHNTVRTKVERLKIAI